MRNFLTNQFCLHFLCGVFLCLALWISNAPTAAAQESSSPVIIEADGQVAWDKAQARYSAEGKVRISRGLWLLQADRVEAYYAPEEVSEAGNTTLPSARDLRLVHALSEKDATKKVIATHQDGTTLTTELLTWHPQDQTLEASQGGTIQTRDKATLSAQGALTHRRFDSNQEESRASGGIEIRTTAGEIIRGNEAVALGANGTPYEYRVLGAVEIIRTSGERATSEVLSYLVGVRKVFLEEQVVLESAGRTLQGDRAEIDLESGRSVLLPKRGEKVQGTFDTQSETQSE